MTNNYPKVILGIDPGLADTGYGVILKENNDLKLLDYGSIKTKKGLGIARRLVIIEKEIKALIKKHKPDIAGIEELFFCRNVTTAMAVGQARGVVMLNLEKSNLPIIELTPLQVKQGITGYGKADKKQIQFMVKAVLKLDSIPKPDDAADALAIAICASNNINLFEI
jgi:crossover junction endodeoxyribonuclease RuvC